MLKIYVGTRLSFAENFSNDFNVVNRIGTMYFSNMVESYLLQGLILECVLFSTHDKMDRFIDELEDELSNTKEALAQKQELLKTITEEIDEAECLQEKLKEAQKKAYEDANEAGEKLDQKNNKLKDSKKYLKEVILSQRGRG